MRKQIAWLAALVCLILSGCSLFHEPEGQYTGAPATDVERYCRQALNTTDRFTVQDGRTVIKGSDGYEDGLYTVTTDIYGLEAPLEFHVIDDRHWSGEWVGRHMTDDLAYQKQRYLMKELDLPEGFELADDLELGYNTGANGWPKKLYVVCRYDAPAEFERAVAFVRSYQEHAKGYPSLNDTEMVLSFELRTPDQESEWRLALQRLWLRFGVETTESEIREALKELEDEYLITCMESGLLPRIEAYSVERRSKALQFAHPHNSEIRRTKGAEVYSGFSYGVSDDVVPYGTLYHILQTEGFEVTGDWKSFQFAGIDGMAHACAYYHTLTKEGIEGNGESMDICTINALTGLDIAEGDSISKEKDPNE